jgi:regulatory protein
LRQSVRSVCDCNRTVKRHILIPVRLWQKNGAVQQSRSNRQSRPLDLSTLQALAVRYVGRYATTRVRLAVYLERKVAERGWVGEGAPPVVAIVERCVDAGYVDDQAFAEAKSRSLARQGYGHRRIEAALKHSGIARGLTEALRPDEGAAFESARIFARKRRIGQFSTQPADQALRRRQFAAMIRAGHSPQLAGYFLGSVPDTDADPQK